MLYRYRRPIKLMIAFSALMLFLGVAALVALHWYVSTDSFKQKVAAAFKDYTGYDLVMEGGMGVTLFPWVGFAAGPVSLRKPGVDEPLISAQRVSAGVRLLPLFSGEFDLDTIALEDVVVEVIRLEDGTTHWDDLVTALTPAEDEASGREGAARGVTLRGVQVENGSLVYRDLGSGRSWEADGFNLRTGVLEQDQAIAVSVETRLASPEHEVEGQVTITGSLEVDFDTGHLRLSQGRMDADLSYALLQKTGDPIRVTATVSLDTASEVLDLDNLYAQASGVDLTGHVRVTGLLTDPLGQGHVETRAFSPRELLNAISPDLIPADDPGIFRQAVLSTDLRLQGQTLTADKLDLRMDDSRVTGTIDIPMGSGGTVGFDLALDGLDFDRYYRLFITPEDFILDDFYPEFVRTWRAKGGLTAEALTIAGEETSDVALSLTSGDGLLAVTVDQARVMGGALTGECSAKVAAEGGDYRVTLLSRAELLDARADSLPLGSGEGHALSGDGDLRLAYEVSEKLMAPDQIIEDLIRDTRMTLDYTLRMGGLSLNDEYGEQGDDQALSWDQARVSLVLTGNGRGGNHDEFNFQAGLALKLLGPERAWDLDGKLSGGLALDFPLDNLTLKGAELGLQYHGEPLPEADPVAVLSALVTLDTGKDSASISDIRLEAAGMVLSGQIAGRQALSREYSYSGDVALESPDPKVALALLRNKKTIRTNDPEALKTLTGRADVLVAGGNLDLVNLALLLDQTTFSGRARIENLGAGRAVFDLQGDGLDLDRYRTPRPEIEEASPAKECSDGSGRPPKPLPLDTLRALDLEGNLSLAAFKVYSFRFHNLKLAMGASGGVIDLSPVTADFYGGKVNSSLDLFVKGGSMDVMFDFDATGFLAEDFLGDQFERDYVRGLSELNFHFKTSGATDDDLIERLGGSSGFTIRDGSYKFLGAAKPGEEVQPAPEDNAMATGNGSKDSRTAFSLAQAGFTITNGRFDLTDFQVKSLALEATGEGNFDVAKNTIDLAINADFMAAPDVPIYIEGCLSDPDVSVPGDEILQNAVEDIISIPLRPLQFLRDTLF